MAKKSPSKAESIEEKIISRIVASGIQLRFDKVALRLLDSVKTTQAQTLPADQSIVFTVTAPIKLPAKTSAALQEWLHRLGTRGSSTTINGNKISARRISGTASHMPRVIGLVHNPESNVDLALGIAETSLHERQRCAR